MVSARVALFRRAGVPLELREVEVASPEPGEVLVDVEVCTLCGSDLHTLRGKRSVVAPMVLGHEIVGTVRATAGDAVAIDGSPVAVGDRVVWSMVVACGRCVGCERGQPEHCTRRFKYGHEPFDRSPLSGGLGAVVRLVPGTPIARVPSVLDPALAATVSCGGATVQAAMRVGGGCVGDRVVIFGAGWLGLTAARWMAAAGAASVHVVEPDASRRALAETVGAEGLERAEPNSADLVLEMSGASAAVATGVDALAVGGRLVLVGSVLPSPSVALDPERVVRGRLSIQGVHNYAPRDFAAALDAMCSAPLPLAAAISEPVALEDLESVLADNAHSERLRLRVEPG